MRGSIDLEQREGRINRYKSLVVRQRLAQAYGDDVGRLAPPYSTQSKASHGPTHQLSAVRRFRRRPVGTDADLSHAPGLR
uniref:Helicase domain protein n=1 Tax=mine drainage metagenome TaxID=410659 RepID=E6PTE2_9ZZZZ